MNSTENENLNCFDDYCGYFDSSFPGWISVFLLTVGLIGNFLCLCVLCQKKMRKHSAFVYLAALSIVDIFVLLFGLGDIVLITYYRYYIRNQDIIICRAHSFLTYLFTHLSSILLALVSVDRAIATNLINFAKTYCKPKMAYKVICCTIIIISLVNLHYLLYLGYEKYDPKLNKTVFECASETDSLYESFMDPYFEWVDLILYSILPFIIMLFCSYLIIRVLFNSAKRLNKNNYSKSENNDTQKKETITHSSTRLEVPNSLHLSKENHRIRSPSLNIQTQPINQTNVRSYTRINKTKHLSYTLITLNVIFFILISPLVIFLIILKGKLTDDSKIIMNALYMLAYSNHSFNFVLYEFSSPPFRNGLRQLFSRKSANLKNNNRNYKTDFINNSVFQRDIELTSNLVNSRSQYLVQSASINNHKNH